MAAARPDVVLLDLDLAGEDGAALVPELLLRAPAARVLVLTAVAQPARQEGAVLAGARGPVHKSQETELLLDAIRRVHAGELRFSGELLDRALERSRPAGRPGALPPDRLTGRERALVTLVAAGHRNAEIARQLHLTHGDWCSPGFWKNATTGAWALTGYTPDALFNATVVPDFYDTTFAADPTLSTTLDDITYKSGQLTSGPYGLTPFNATGAFLSDSIPGYQFDVGFMQYDDSQTCPIDHFGNWKQGACPTWDPAITCP